MQYLVRQWIHVLRQYVGGYGRISHTFSSLRQNRILKCCFPSVAERRSVPSRCFWLQFCSAQFALGKLEVLLELHVADTGDDGQHFFAAQCGIFSASSSELRPVVTGSCQFISTSCGHTHPVSEHASETTTTTISTGLCGYNTLPQAVIQLHLCFRMWLGPQVVNPRGPVL